MRAKFLTVCIALAAAAPLAASAEDAFTAGFTDVFAGPSSDYPPIAQLPPNTEVTLAGCLSDWSWCDVVVGPNHGWVYAGDLVVPYQGQRLVILQYGPRYHFVPVVTFSLVTYWDRYYRSRPFYAERNVWVNRVHIAAGHGGRAPAGHEAAARQNAPVQAQAPRNEPNARAAGGERGRTAQNEKARTNEADRTRASQNERARTFQPERSPPPQTASRPEQTQRPQTAQAPRNEQPRQEQRKAAEPQQAPRTAQAERPREAQPQRAEPRQQAARTEAAPRESRNAPREESRNAPREEKKDGKEG